MKVYQIYLSEISINCLKQILIICLQEKREQLKQAEMADAYMSRTTSLMTEKYKETIMCMEKTLLSLEKQTRSFK